MIPLAAERLRGSYVPLVTPFHGGELDEDAFTALVEEQVAAGSHGVVVTGTSGEPTSLSVAERARLYALAVEAAGGRLEVVAATGAVDQRDTLRLTRAAEEVGVDAALVIVPPFVRPSQHGLIAHFGTVASATSLPVLIYNIPGRSGVAIDVASVVRVAEEHENVVGLKHASTDLDAVTELLVELGDDFRIFCGLESLSYPMLALGAAGLMNAVGNVAPAPVAALCEAVAAGDHVRALALHRELFDVSRAVFFDTNPGPIKHMLSVLGRGSDEVRPPLAPLTAEVAARVEAVVGRMSVQEEQVS